jgi:hypothetical protein
MTREETIELALQAHLQAAKVFTHYKNSPEALTDFELAEIVAVEKFANLIESAAIKRLAVGAGEPFLRWCKDCRITGAFHCHDPINCGGMIDIYTAEQVAAAVAVAIKKEQP